MRSIVFILILIFQCFVFGLWSQNYANNWAFGMGAGISFNSNPPQTFSSANNINGIGVSAWSDPNGNLVFYSNATSAWNSSHTLIANGTGMNQQGSQVVIVPLPGSQNIYYIFSCNNALIGLQYSIVDMSLASGQGSVTAKGIQVAQGIPMQQQIAAIPHCNGTDVWIITHRYQSADFYAWLFTSGGINNTPVISTTPFVYSATASIFKCSPNGQLIASNWNGGGPMHLQSFDKATGAVTNAFQLSNACASMEFSPNGSKLYCLNFLSTFSTTLIQWDVCAGTPTAIAATEHTQAISGNMQKMQLAPNGIIYLSPSSTGTIINAILNPNNTGASCNYSTAVITLTTGLTSSFPSFLNGFIAQNPPGHSLPSFSFQPLNNLGCYTEQFFVPPSVFSSTIGGACSSNYSVTGIRWNFGDPLSGPSNTSTINNPIHVYPANGLYTVSLIVDYTCGGGSDTITQVVNINQPCVSVASSSISCSGLGSATVTANVGIGPYSYTWFPGSQTGSVATGLQPGTYTVSVFDAGNNLSSTATVNLVSSLQFTGSLVATSSLTCHGVNNGSATIINLSGGSGTQNYLWTNGNITLNSSSVTSLSAGTWSLTVTDALTSCQIHSVFIITQPPALTLQINAPGPIACIPSVLSLTGSATGGTPFNNNGYNFVWSNGPSINGSISTIYSVALNNSGVVNFSLTVTDANGCMQFASYQVTVVPSLILSTTSASICPFETGTINVSGANSYTWSSAVIGSSMTASPTVTTVYTVTGEALGCSASGSASIIIKSPPIVVITSNNPVCEGSPLFLQVGGGSSQWIGPQSFVSNVNSNTINPAQLNQSGLYEVTVTAANACTASASASITVKPLPQFTTTPSSASICANTTSLTLSVFSSTLFSASSYTWFPNSGLSSNSGTFVNAFPGSTTIYTVTGSLNGCTNSLQSTVNVVPPPSLTAQLSSNTLCSQAFNGSPNTITLTAGGAITYSLVTFPDMSNANPGGPVSPLTAIPPYSGLGTATLSGSNGVCTVTTSLTFSILPNPTIAVNNYTPIICAGETFTYTNQGANTYTWSTATPNFTTYSNGGVAVAHPSINSVFSVYGGSLGCNSALHTSTITVIPLPTVQINPDPLNLCLGDTLLMFAQSNATVFQWYPPYGLTSYTNQQVSTFINQNQHYTVVATLNNCSNTAVAAVSIMPLPSAVIVPVIDEVCLMEAIHLKGEGGLFYEWIAPNLQTYTLQNLQLGMSHLSLAGTYTLKVVDANACVNYSTHPVVVHDLPQGYLTPKQTEFCVPYCNSFTFVPNTLSNITEAGPWALNDNIFVGYSFTNCFTKTGEFEIKGPIVDEYGCKNTVQVNVIGRPKPIAAFYVTPENPVEGLDEVQFVNVTSNIIGYSWQATGASPSPSTSLGSGSGQGLGMTQNSWVQFKSEDESPRYLFDEAGVYGLMLIVKNEFNCIDTVMKTIKVDSDFTAYIPNAFTPNGDGLNDTFYPVMRGVKKFELQIFDRWGELVFSSKSAEHVWDGTFKGQECKQDVYNYKLLLLNVKGEEKMYGGSVMLYR